jgi:K+-transporting ATPase ATPase C chain
MLLVVLTVLTGIIYPLAVTGAAQALFPRQANGSLVEKDGKIIGSAVIGQEFKGAHYFHGRPSATVTPDPKDATKTVPAPYNAANSGASNLAPSAKAFVDGVAANVAAVKGENPDEPGPVPADLVTASASGLDPHISPSAAAYQLKRVALSRHAPQDEVRKLITAHTEARTVGVLGEPVVNVLALNLALDERWPMR